MGCANEVMQQCEVCWASETGPISPIADASSASPFKEEPPAGPNLLVDAIASVRWMRSPRSPSRRRSAARSLWNWGIPYAASGLRFVAGRNVFRWMRAANEMQTDFRTGRQMTLKFQGVGAHHWLLEKRNARNRGIYDRSEAGDRFASTQNWTGAQEKMAYRAKRSP